MTMQQQLISMFGVPVASEHHVRAGIFGGALNFARRAPPVVLLFPASSAMLVTFVILTCTFDAGALRIMLTGSDTKTTCTTTSHHHVVICPFSAVGR